MIILRNNNWKPRDNQQKTGLVVTVRNGNIDGAIRKFKKKVQDAGIVQEIRERQQYTKPSERRRKAKAAGRARWLKKQAKQKQDLGY